MPNQSQRFIIAQVKKIATSMPADFEKYFVRQGKYDRNKNVLKKE
jgi:hypothetical protein